MVQSVIELEPLGTVPDRFPNELVRLILEISARSDGKTALNIFLAVSGHDRKWIEPIVYAHIVIHSHRNAALFLKVMPAKPRGFFATHVKSIAIGDSVTLQQSRAILAGCSQSVVDFAVWGNTRNPTIFLPFIRSRTLRRLSLKAQHASELSFPPTLLASLTHLMVLDGPYSWFQMREAVRWTKWRETNNLEYRRATVLFRSLTHFGVCSKNWGSMQAILKVAVNLRYFLVIVPPNVKTNMIAHRIEEIGDRRVVLLQYSQTVDNWDASARGEESVWERAEKLVTEGYFTEYGRKWKH
ncbi:hypothetical protein H0H81_008982 [Sphagnurus paluster]|uniref:Uncharacterized protein n=1 Tax=Sphagnurus paluster TaxID=117069 RepID=A0A9P7K5T9_9AGAR|nr:hypothetical protein H0H81_008982 [Sphagnurus paluster]